MIKSFTISVIPFLLFVFNAGFAQKHLELPAISKEDEIVHHKGYTLSYNEKYEQANWVAYELTREETDKSFERTNKFLPDPLVHTGSATDADYASSGYDRGHLAPAADMGWSQETMYESFYFSNMSPQTPSFNRGIWKHLEEMVREWAIEYDTLYIATGPVFEGEMPVIGPNKVAVPPFYYKAILTKSDGHYQAIGFILPNEASSANLSDFAVSVDSVEHKTHINFFASMEDAQEEKVEHNLCVSCWTWNKSKSHHSTKLTETEKLNTTEHHTSSDQSVQCQGITKKGERCKKMTKDPSGYCYIHQKLH